MASSTQPCYLLDIPPELRLIIYEHVFYEFSLAIKYTWTRKLSRNYREKVKELSEFLFTSRLIMREAHPVFEKPLIEHIAEVRSALEHVHHWNDSRLPVAVFNRKWLTDAIDDMVKALQGTTDWATRWLDRLEKMEANVREGKCITLDQASEVNVTELRVPRLGGSEVGRPNTES